MLDFTSIDLYLNHFMLHCKLHRILRYSGKTCLFIQLGLLYLNYQYTGQFVCHIRALNWFVGLVHQTACETRTNLPRLCGWQFHWSFLETNCNSTTKEVFRRSHVQHIDMYKTLTLTCKYIHMSNIGRYEYSSWYINTTIVYKPQTSHVYICIYKLFQ